MQDAPGLRNRTLPGMLPDSRQVNCSGRRHPWEPPSSGPLLAAPGPTGSTATCPAVVPLVLRFLLLMACALAEDSRTCRCCFVLSHRSRLAASCGLDPDDGGAGSGTACRAEAAVSPCMWAWRFPWPPFSRSVPAGPLVLAQWSGWQSPSSCLVHGRPAAGPCCVPSALPSLPVNWHLRQDQGCASCWGHRLPGRVSSILFCHADVRATSLLILALCQLTSSSSTWVSALREQIASFSFCAGGLASMARTARAAATDRQGSRPGRHPAHPAWPWP